MYYNYVNYIIVIFFVIVIFLSPFHALLIYRMYIIIQVTIDYFDVMYYMHS